MQLFANKTFLVSDIETNFTASGQTWPFYDRDEIFFGRSLEYSRRSQAMLHIAWLPIYQILLFVYFFYYIILQNGLYMSTKDQMQCTLGHLEPILLEIDIKNAKA